jgi:hypothetical protein
MAGLLQRWLEGERIRMIAESLELSVVEVENRMIVELRELDRRITGPSAVPPPSPPDLPPAA